MILTPNRLNPTSSPIHIGIYNPRLDMEDTEALVRKTQRLPQPNDRALANTIRRQQGLVVQMRGVAININDNGVSRGVPGKRLRNVQRPADIYAHTFQERSAVYTLDSFKGPHSCGIADEDVDFGVPAFGTSPTPLVEAEAEAMNEDGLKI
ncbi:hypothetical protein BDW62DRAFT_152621 [Aspergillus aurantiobrunneus]